ncbi:hypothetical protein Q5P01_022820 [Channa striata]|uniref:Uncharacterized protein n=1 Tax=Channa striata TaxID=64152 RepID=A0AA88LRN1_CHASR|nr:hypothetical protein Q5P01_022820 [Channa striata]
MERTKTKDPVKGNLSYTHRPLCFHTLRSPVVGDRAEPAKQADEHLLSHLLTNRYDRERQLSAELDKWMDNIDTSEEQE